MTGETDGEGAADPYADWQATLDTISDTRGTVLLLGGMDVGKTTFARLLVNRLVAAGREAAVLDADLGQSEIGPPACVGFGIANAPIRALSDIAPTSLAFVGSTSPQGFLLEHAIAVGRLAGLAAGRPLVVDTSGYLHGNGARRLHGAVFDLLAPAHVVGLARGPELDAILAPMRRRDGCAVHTPAIPDVIGRKPPAFRAQRRAMRWAAAFEDAALHTYAFEDVAFVGTWMGAGTPVAAHLLKFLSQTLQSRARVFYAEMSDRHLGIMVSQPIGPNAPELGLIQEPFKASALTLTVAPRLKHLLVGLEAANGKLLGLGLVGALDFRRRSLGILTTLRAPDAAKVIRFGALRVSPEGRELGALKPGEI